MNGPIGWKPVLRRHASGRGCDESGFRGIATKPGSVYPKQPFAAGEISVPVPQSDTMSVNCAEITRPGLAQLAFCRRELPLHETPLPTRFIVHLSSTSKAQPAIIS